MLISFINNISLLLALSICHSFILRRWKPNTIPYQITSGILFGCITIAGMMNPFVLTDGIIFDGRSFVASVAGFMGGSISAVLVVILGGIYRVWGIGGGGSLMGVCVLTTSAGLGVIYRYWKRDDPEFVHPLYLYCFGIVVHISMILWMFTLPSSQVWNAISKISLPVLIIFPVCTVILGKMLQEQINSLSLHSALKKSEAKYRELVENANSIILRCDIDGNVNFFNEFAQDFFGYSEREIIGQPMVGTIIPETDSTGSDLSEIVKQVINNPDKYSMYENENILKNGERVWISWTNKVISDENNVPVEFLCIGTDITERRQFEEALAKNEHIFRSAIEVAGAVPYYQNYLTGTYDFVGQGIEELTGYSPDEFTYEIWQSIEQETIILSNDLIGLSIDDAVEKTKNVEGISWWADTRIKTRMGEERWISNAAVQVRDDRGTVTGSLGILQNITGRKKMEEELLKSRKLDSIGILAGGIAHDYNNLLMAIIGNISLARTFSDSPEEANECLLEADKAANQAKKLTQQLLTFSKGGAPIKESANVVELIKETVTFSTRGSNVSCAFHLSENLWYVDVDKGQFSQVIQNLVINADQAMPDGGIIEIKGENITVSENDTKKGSALRKGDYIKISITDQGVGISQEHLPKIFDPYFSTKQKGSGLGLATTYSIVKKHQGRIVVESQIGKGTVFSLYLPRSMKETIVDQETDRGYKHTGQGRILLMDDDEMIRKIAGGMLEKIGYEVDFAKDGYEIIDKYKNALESKNEFDALVMDLTIPGSMGGREAIQKLLEINPQIKAVVSSGYSSDPIMAEYQHFGFSGVISKPYKIEELGIVMENVMKE